MDKGSLIVILNECFQTEDSAAYLHLIDGSILLVTKSPKFFNTNFRIIKEYDINEKTINEEIYVPYSSVNYITLTNFKNLEIVDEQYNSFKK